MPVLDGSKKRTILFKSQYFSSSSINLLWLMFLKCLLRFISYLVWESQAAITMNSSNQGASFLCSFFFPQSSPQIFLLFSASGITLSLKISPLSSWNTFFCWKWGIWLCRYWFILFSYRLIFSDFAFSCCFIFSMTTLIPIPYPYPIKEQLADDLGFKYSHRERTM